jgi:hypothetical protein
MPSAPRERKPALAALAVILIIGGAAAAGLLVMKSGHRVGAIEITQQIQQGEQIPMSAMKEVQIASDSGVNYVSWIYVNQVTQYFAANVIPAGTLLNNGMVAKTKNLPNGRSEVGLALKDGQVPGNLQDGDTINIYSTQAGQSGGGCPGKPGATLASGATVINLSQGGNGSNMTDVVVAMAPEAVGAVVCNTANNTAGIAIVPGNGVG